MASTFLLVIAATVFITCATGQEIRMEIEKPGVHTTTIKNYRTGKETFETFAVAKDHQFVSKFHNDHLETKGSYSDAYILDIHDAGCKGRYVRTDMGKTTSIKLTRPVELFGMWLSSFQGGMRIVFLKDDQEIQTFTSADILSLLNESYNRHHPSLYSAFINFICSTEDCKFNQVKIVAESDWIFTDNHTIGARTEKTPKKEHKKEKIKAPVESTIPVQEY